MRNSLILCGIFFLVLFFCNRLIKIKMVRTLPTQAAASDSDDDDVQILDGKDLQLAQLKAELKTNQNIVLNQHEIIKNLSETKADLTLKMVHLEKENEKFVSDLEKVVEDFRVQKHLDGILKDAYNEHIEFLEKHSNKMSAELDKVIAEEATAWLMCSRVIDENDDLKEEIKELKRPKLKRNNTI